MRKGFFAVALLFSVALTSRAQVVPWEEYAKLVDSSQSITALGPNLFGDQVNLSNGSLSFSATDVSVPGNSALPVAVGRTFNVSNRKGYDFNDLPFADWDLDVPRMSGVFATSWQGGILDAPQQRCSITAVGAAQPPSLAYGDSYFTARDYWHGNQLTLPGGGGGELMLRQDGVPAPSAGGPYYWVTSDYTYLSCLSAVGNDEGEGFLAITPDGTKYWFNWMARYAEPELKSGKDGQFSRLARGKRVLYATRVEDRFGNWVTYSYSNASQSGAVLNQINASDGRSLSLSYNARGHIASISNGTQTWHYEYTYPSGTKGSLTAVILPDSSRWAINFAPFEAATIGYYKGAPGEPERDCFNAGDAQGPLSIVGSITHPSGATGEFEVQIVRHGKSNVPAVCENYSTVNGSPTNVGDDMAYYPMEYDQHSLTRKRITGPGLPIAEWNYSYQSFATWYYIGGPGTSPICPSGTDCSVPRCVSDDCAGTSKTIVAGPEGEWTRYTFGNSFRYNEGKLLKVERGAGANSIVRVDDTRYLWPVAGQQFATPIGRSIHPRRDGFAAAYLRPISSSTTTLDGVTFNRRVNTFDGRARPLNTSRWSSLGYTKTDSTEYYDHSGLWVLGQVLRRLNADSGQVIEETEYDSATALPVSRSAFGKLQHSLTYNTDGTVSQVRDGNNNATTASNWKRGIPQTVLHPDQKSVSAVVNDVGWVMSATDENGFTTRYAYDAMGRMSNISYPAEDSTLWNDRTTSFLAVANEELGIPAGHWKQVVQQGDYRKTSYYDAMWRAIAEQEEDIADPAGTTRWTTRRFDALGRNVFESYPRNPFVDGVVNAGAAAAGSRIGYDIIGRETRREQDSELGPLVTTTDYLSGFQRRITNPRRFEVTQRFQVYDEPVYDAPVRVDMPHSTSTTIIRDRYLKPLEVTRSGPDG
ncbi:wall associated protein [Lysobacter soli]|uniref:wall associated protein n=1 Tax=Lysobacter soli TaxID=453783 RepID=UPI0037C95B8B